jgi:hypothetical protein
LADDAAISSIPEVWAKNSLQWPSRKCYNAIVNFNRRTLQQFFMENNTKASVGCNLKGFIPPAFGGRHEQRTMNYENEIKTNSSENGY